MSEHHPALEVAWNPARWDGCGADRRSGLSIDPSWLGSWQYCALVVVEPTVAVYDPGWVEPSTLGQIEQLLRNSSVCDGGSSAPTCMLPETMRHAATLTDACRRLFALEVWFACIFAQFVNRSNFLCPSIT
jgi:hypothetical protein